MKRLWRWVCNVGFGLSMLVWVMAIVLWVRSYWACDAVHWKTPERGCVMLIPQGTFVLAIWNGRLSGFKDGLVHQPMTPQPPFKGPAMFGNLTSFAGFGYAIHRGIGEASVMVQIPLWGVLLTSSIWPTMWLLRHRQTRLANRRRASNCCIACGYDLRATPERCPECGAVPETAKGAAT